MARTQTDLVIRFLVKGLGSVKTAFKSVTESQKLMRQEAQKTTGMIISSGMAMLFGGMAIKRFFMNILRGSVNTYQTIFENSDIMMTKITELQAAWEFFKFSLMDALMQSELFISMVDWIIALANWFGQLDENSRSIMGFLILGGILLGFALQFAGQAMLFAFGMSLLLGVGFWAIVLVIGLLLILLAVLVLIWTSSLSKSEKKMLTVITVIAAVGLAILSLGGLVAAPFAIMAAAVIGIILLFAFMRKEIFQGFKNVLLAYEGFMLNMVANMLDSMHFMLINVISAINAIIRAINIIPGINIGEIGHPMFLANAAFALRKRIVRRGDEAEADFAAEGGGDTMFSKIGSAITGFSIKDKIGDAIGIEIPDKIDISNILLEQIKSKLDEMEMFPKSVNI